jgi:hypothetical protein
MIKKIPHIPLECLPVFSSEINDPGLPRVVNN